MRTSAWAPLFAFSALACGLAFAPTQQFVLAIQTSWWVIPVAASAASVTGLSFSLIPRTGWGRFSARAYLVPGPAMAAVSLLPGALPVAAPPVWTTYIMPALFLGSALLFYLASGDPEADGQLPGPPRGGLA